MKLTAIINHHHHHHGHLSTKPTPKINHYHQAQAEELKLKEEFLANNSESSKNFLTATKTCWSFFIPPCFQTWSSPNVVLNLCEDDALNQCLFPEEAKAIDRGRVSWPWSHSSATITSTITLVFGGLVLVTLPDYVAALMRSKIGVSARHDMLLREFWEKRSETW